MNKLSIVTKAVLGAALSTVAHSAQSEVTLPKVSCVLNRTFDVSDGKARRIYPKSEWFYLPAGADPENRALPSIFLRANPSWDKGHITLEEQERATQIMTDSNSLLDKAKEVAGNWIENWIKVQTGISSFMPPTDEQMMARAQLIADTYKKEVGENCIEYKPTISASTVTIGHRVTEIRKPETFDLIYGPEEHLFIPVALTLTKIKNEKYDTATQRVVSNEKYSLLAGIGWKLGDYYAKYPALYDGGRGDPATYDNGRGYLDNVSISLLVRPEIGGRTWGAGPAISYRLGDGGAARYSDIFVSAIKTKGDGQGARNLWSFSVGILIPLSRALHPSN